MQSLQARLSIGLTLSIIVLVTLLLLVGQYLLRQLAETFVAVRIEQDIEALLSHIDVDSMGQIQVNNEGLNPIFNQPYSGHYYQIAHNGQVVRSRSLWDTQLPMWTEPDESESTVQIDLLEGPEGQHLLALNRQFLIKDQTVRVLLTEDISDLSAGIVNLIIWLGVAALVILIVLLFIQSLIIHKSLSPLRKSQTDMQRLAKGEIKALDSYVASEIQPFIIEINRLIEIMQQRLTRSRHALGNLAHALKTPLTRLSQINEQTGQQINREQHNELSALTAQIRALIERELKRARIVGSATPGQRVLMTDEVNDLLLTLGKVYRDKKLSVQCEIPVDSWFPGDRDDLLELLGNLLDNAYKWATTTVSLKTTASNNQLYISVEDDGPGCSPEQIELLTRRGVRIDEGVVAGYGLGLAIVTDIVEQYRGQLRFLNSEELSGLRVDVKLALS